MTNLLSSDLDHVLAHTQGLWNELRNQRLFITGGTGFIGCWLLESLAWANDKLGLNIRAVVLTRNSKAFASKAPHLASHPAIAFHGGDVRNFEFPEGEFSHVIHAATEAGGKSNADNPLAMFETIVQGTRRTLDFAVKAGAKQILLTSSGAVYGRQPPEMPNIPEDYDGAPDALDPVSAYGEGKRAAEMLCSLYARQHGLEPKIARCFAFVGPYLPLDSHFAVGNFIRDTLRGGPVLVNGDGTTYRSYLYAADLAIWLWTILLRGRVCRAYNVGSSEALTIAEIARLAASASPTPVAVKIANAAVPGRTGGRYVPDTQRAEKELALRPTITAESGIRRTMAWQISLV